MRDPWSYIVGFEFVFIPRELAYVSVYTEESLDLRCIEFIHELAGVRVVCRRCGFIHREREGACYRCGAVD